MQKKKIGVLSLIFIFLILSRPKTFKNNNEHNHQNNYIAITKTTKYKAEDIYKFMQNKSWPNTEELHDIILNWYDYYPKNTPFITSWGEYLNYEEYEKIKQYYNHDSKKLFRLLLSSSKDNFKTILERN